ncbi:MAG: hypothetical protein BroJett011_54680 [Chloroflexota bacterium]|nr:MAG: hypothetical protein BroJett011_54680 [Chloroflexota bacterium]
MNQDLFEVTLKVLAPKTLAYLIRDLEETQADWNYYPEDAPPETVQQELRQMLEAIQTLAAERAAAEGLDFARLLQQASEEQRQEEWSAQRNTQVQQNWLSDLQ